MYGQCSGSKWNTRNQTASLLAQCSRTGSPILLDQKRGTWEKERAGRRNSWNFYGGPGVKAPAAIAGGVGSIPGGRTKIPPASRMWPKKAASCLFGFSTYQKQRLTENRLKTRGEQLTRRPELKNKKPSEAQERFPRAIQSRGTAGGSATSHRKTEGAHSLGFVSSCKPRVKSEVAGSWARSKRTGGSPPPPPHPRQQEKSHHLG